MSTVKQALSKLGSAVSKLETSMDHLEGALAGRQRDMFAVPPPAVEPAKTNNNFAADNAMIAQRLDSAIKRVEELLEG